MDGRSDHDTIPRGEYDMPNTGRAMTANERKAKERAEKRAMGLEPLQLWVKPEHKDPIRELAAELLAQDLKTTKKV